MSRAYSPALKTFQGLSLPFMLPKGSNKQLCRACRAVTLCARTHRLTRARRIGSSPSLRPLQPHLLPVLTTDSMTVT